METNTDCLCAAFFNAKKMADYAILTVGTMLAGAAAYPSWVLDANDYLLRDMTLVNRETSMLIFLTALALSMAGMLFASVVGSVRGR